MLSFKFLKSVTVFYFLFISNLFSQEWASMSYTVDKKSPYFFIGFFKSESKKDIVFGKNCIDQNCIYEMTPTVYIGEMERLGWEVSEVINFKGQKELHVIWFRRYN